MPLFNANGSYTEEGNRIYRRVADALAPIIGDVDNPMEFVALVTDWTTFEASMLRMRRELRVQRGAAQNAVAPAPQEAPAEEVEDVVF